MHQSGLPHAEQFAVGFRLQSFNTLFSPLLFSFYLYPYTTKAKHHQYKNIMPSEKNETISNQLRIMSRKQLTP
tara:strand:- start:4 stop:222 length:219 start_codon:yes stop_codon:yes gene_type:complete